LIVGTVFTAVLFGIGRLVHISEIDDLFKKIRLSLIR
jgi:hypothetical protein